MRKTGAVLLLVLFPLLMYGQELTLYVIPPLVPANWHSPRSLYWSYIKSMVAINHNGGRRHPIGHVVVELRDSTRYALVGMAAKHRAEMVRKFCLDGYGMGIIYASFHGTLHQEHDNHPDLLAGYLSGNLAYVQFRLSRQAFALLWQYLQEYQLLGYDKIYNGENKPREGKGAGCSAFAESFVELAGLLPPEEIAKWQVTLHVPGKLIGGPHARKLLSSPRILLKGKWPDTTTPHTRKIVYYDPTLMYEWIQEKWLQPLADGYYKEIRGRANGIIIDCTQKSLPGIPLWLNKQQ